MVNAKLELLEVIDGLEVAAAIIEYGYYERDKKFILKKYHSHNDWLHFLEQLNFEYDAGFGGQEIYGTVWLTDGTWLERGEYDGSEWWERKVLPPMPAELTD